MAICTGCGIGEAIDTDRLGKVAEEAYGGLGGLSYSRRVMSSTRLMGTALTNGVFMCGIGFDF